MWLYEEAAALSRLLKGCSSSQEMDHYDGRLVETRRLSPPRRLVGGRKPNALRHRPGGRRTDVQPA